MLCQIIPVDGCAATLCLALRRCALQVALVGAPNVGKSSLVQLLSSGLPEVQNYPFTTRSIKMGHFYVAGRRHQVTGGWARPWRRVSNLRLSSCLSTCISALLRRLAWLGQTLQSTQHIAPLPALPATLQTRLAC